MAWSYATSIRVVMLWSLLALMLYLFPFQSTSPIPSLPSSSSSYSNPLSMKDVHIDAFVFIAMSETATRNNIDYSVASLRKVGQWKGDIFIITDKPDCFAYLNQFYATKILSIPSVSNLMAIKALKTNLFLYLPNKTNTIVYMDVDVIVSKPIQSFLESISSDVHQMMRASLKRDIMNGIESVQPSFDFAMFPDAKGHYVGFCSGCEKWHTGVIVLQRQAPSEEELKEKGGTVKSKERKCLIAWREMLLSGKYTTDQESIDAAEAEGGCPKAVSLSTKHLLFAKDVLGMLLLSGQTFVHLTGIERLEKEGYLYRKLILPRIYKSLEPLVSRKILSHAKVC